MLITLAQVQGTGSRDMQCAGADLRHHKNAFLKGLHTLQLGQHVQAGSDLTKATADRQHCCCYSKGTKQTDVALVAAWVQFWGQHDWWTLKQWQTQCTSASATSNSKVLIQVWHLRKAHKTGQLLCHSWVALCPQLARQGEK